MFTYEPGVMHLTKTLRQASEANEWRMDPKQNSKLEYFCQQYPHARDCLFAAQILRCYVFQSLETDNNSAHTAVFLQSVSKKSGLRQIFKNLGLPWQWRFMDLSVRNTFSLPVFLFSSNLSQHPFLKITDIGLRKGDLAHNQRLTVNIETAFTCVPDCTIFARWLVNLPIYLNNSDAQDLSDYARHRMGEGLPWPKQWTLAQAKRAMDKWHEDAAQADLAGYDDEVEIVPEGICPVFSVITKSKYRIDAKVLLTRRQLALESKIMQHCVGQDHMKYHKKWAAGAAIYLHLETVELDKDGAEIGAGHGFTLEMYRQRVEMERQWAPTQIRGKFNASAPSWLRNTVKTGAFYDVLMSKKQKFAPLKQTLKGEHNGSN